MGTINNLDRSINEYTAIPLDGYIQSLALAAGVAKRVAIPTGAVAVLFSATKNFTAAGGNSGVTAVWPIDISDGTAHEVNPVFRRLTSETHISIYMEEAGVITMRFLKVPAG